MQLSWFLAWVTLDQRRIEQKRNGLLPFIVHGEWQRPEGSGEDASAVIMRNVAKFLQKGFFQALIILVTLAILTGITQIHMTSGVILAV